MTSPKISIAIPAYNGEKYLEQALESALRQTRPADEILVIDDASTDATAGIAMSYGNKIKYHFNDKASGFVDAWNRAIINASGDFVTILHHDDLLHSEYLERIELAIKQFSLAKHFYAACNYINASGFVVKNPPLPHSLEPVLYSGRDYAHNYLKGVMSNNHIHRCPGVTTSKFLLMNECTYRKEAGHIADDDFFYRVGRYTDVVGISYPLASFRSHADSETAKADLTERLAACYVFQTLQTKSNECIFCDADKQLIFSAAVKYINEFLFYKLLNNDSEGISKALKNADELADIMPGIMKLKLPVWARIMWLLTEKSSLETSHGYVVCLNLMKRLQDILVREQKLSGKNENTIKEMIAIP
ncbi:MAG: glycosyltransferase family A protein [Smithella sp.]